MSAPIVQIDAIVRLRDATPGTELLDGDGERWTRTATGATFHPPDRGYDRGNFDVDWPEDELDDADDEHGPFRLVGGAT